jgi:hypothetical protein
MKPVLAVLGIGMIILGFFGLTRVTWLGWLDIIVGVVALLVSASRAPRSAEYGGIGLGVASLLVWIAALATGAPGWLTWLTFLFGVGYILTSPLVSRTTLPPGRGPGSTIPPR